MYKKLLNSDNYMKFLANNTKLSRLKQIHIGYELQAGSYEKLYFFDDLMEKRIKILKNTVMEILELKNQCSIIEIGIGEGNTMRHLVENLEEKILDKITFYGVELSFSRSKITKQHLKNCNVIVSDMNNLPFTDNSFDIVYTASAIEPNINCEKDILKELYRISSYKLILFEISYKDAPLNIKERFDEHKYIKYLHETIIELGYILEKYIKLMENNTYNNYLYLIKKNEVIDTDEKNVTLVSPIFNDKLELITYDNKLFYKSEHLNLFFQIIDNIPILLIDSSIIIN